MKSLNVILMFFVALCILVSCKDTTIEPNKSDNIYKIKVVDSLSNKPIPDAFVLIYYETEAVSSISKIVEDVDEYFNTEPMAYPNPSKDIFNLVFGLPTRTQVKIDILDNNNKFIFNAIDNQYLEVGMFVFSTNADSMANCPPGFYKANIYCNDSLAKTIMLLYTPKWFIKSDLLEPSILPFKELRTNANGECEINKSDFTLCNNESFDETEMNGVQNGKKRVINGCYFFVHNSNCKIAQGAMVFDSNHEVTIQAEHKSK